MIVAKTGGDGQVEEAVAAELLLRVELVEPVVQLVLAAGVVEVGRA